MKTYSELDVAQATNNMLAEIAHMRLSWSEQSVVTGALWSFLSDLGASAEADSLLNRYHHCIDRATEYAQQSKAAQ